MDKQQEKQIMITFDVVGGAVIASLNGIIVAILKSFEITWYELLMLDNEQVRCIKNKAYKR